MNVESAWKNYRSVIAGLKALSFANDIIYYDAMTAAPEQSAAGRGKALEYLSGEEYRLRTSRKMKNALAFLSAHLGELDDTRRREIAFYNRTSEYVASIPEEEYVSYTVMLNEAESVWHRAKRENDYAAFEPYLKRIFADNRRFASYYKPQEKPYDVCLGMYEPGLTMEKADAFFKKLREKLVPVIRAIAEKPQIDDSFFYKTYPVTLQRELSDELMRMMAIDRTRCAIGETEHPFTLGTGKNDQRITTHYYENNLISSMYSVIHEGGHALYDMGGDDAYEGTPLAGGVSMGIHESQSRLYENMLGRSRSFIRAVAPTLHRLFPEQLKDVGEEQLWRAVNKSSPSLIRTEADELTYPLHVLIRYEIEKGMMDGSYDTASLPAVWNAKMKEYLGVDVPSDREGILQDSHWSGGAVGYFPSYALGSAYAAQFMAVMRRDVAVDAALEAGDFSPVNTWLDEHIHRHGCRYDPDELIEMVCHEPFSPDYYIGYLTDKYSALYGLGR